MYNWPQLRAGLGAKSWMVTNKELQITGFFYSVQSCREIISQRIQFQNGKMWDWVHDFYGIRLWRVQYDHW